MVISSAFESSVGLAQYAHLAAALEGLHPTQSPRPSSRAARTAASGDPGGAFSLPAGLSAVAAARGGSHFTTLPEADAGVQQHAAASLSGVEAGSGLGSGPYTSQGLRGTAHGLGTAGWFEAEPAPLRLQRLETLENQTMDGRGPGAGTSAQGCDASSRPAWGLGVSLAHAQSLWEAHAGNPGTGSNHAAGAARAPAEVTGQPGFLLGPELAPEPDPRVFTRTVATRAGRYTFRAVELGGLAGRGNPARDPVSGDAAAWPAAAASAAAASLGGPQLEHAHVSGRASFAQALDIGSGPGRAFKPISRVADPDAAPTLVLLHGFLGAAEDWAAMAAGLGVNPRVSGSSLYGPAWVRSERSGWRCLALDLPGHGGSSVNAARGGASPLLVTQHSMRYALHEMSETKRVLVFQLAFLSCSSQTLAWSDSAVL